MKFIDADKLIAEIKRLEEMDYPCDTLEQSEGFYDALDRIKSFIASLQQEQSDFPTTDEQVKEFLATHPKIEVPEKYKNPDFLFKKQEPPTEDWREKRKEECPFRRNLDNNLYGCERYADVVFACDGNCSWVVDYPKLKEIQDMKEQKQPEEICSKCIHHGKDDDGCYNPHGGMKRRINENGVCECTGFCEKEQEQPTEGIKGNLEEISSNVDLEEAAEEYALSLSKSSMGGKEYCKQDFKAGAEWTFKQFSDILDKWEEHAIEGMKVGASAYHQGKIALICDLRDWIKEQTKK